MSVTRINKFIAAVGKAQELITNFRFIIEYIKSSEGNISCEMMTNSGDKNEIVILEVWESIEDHKKSLEEFPKEKMGPIMKLISSTSSGNYYSTI